MRGGRPKSPPGSPSCCLLPADLPDHARPRNLDERRIRGVDEPAVGIGLAEVAHRAVIDEVRAIIGTEFEVHRTVDAAKPVHERLLEGRVVGKPRLLKLKGITRLAEVDQLHVVPRLRRAIGRREPEIALARDQRGALPDRTGDEGIRPSGG
jgi:hypothetical protein